MASDTTVAVGPNGGDDYRKLVVDSSGLLRTKIEQGEMQISGLAVGGRVQIIALDDTAWVALPSSALANRNTIIIQNQSGNGNIILLNYDSSASFSEGFRIEDGGYRGTGLTASVTIYGRMLTGSGIACVEEIA